MIKGTQNFPVKSALKAAILIIVVTLRLFPLFFSEDTYTRIKKFSSFLVSESFFFTINICWISLNVSPIAFEKFLYFFDCVCSDFCYFLMLNQSFSSVQFSHSVVSDSLWPHESHHARPPCPSPTPGVHSDSRPSSQWCHPAISSSVVPFSSCPQSLPAS